MRKSSVLGSLAALGLAVPAFAQEGFSYSYVEAAYVTTDLDDDVLGVDLDGDGFGLRGSVAFSEMFHGYVNYANQDFDFDVDLESWEIGLGASHSIATSVDLIGRIGYAKWDADVVDVDGFSLQAGVRGRLAERFEAEGLLHYVDLDDAGDSTSLVVNGRYFVTDAFAVGLGAEVDDDATTWNVALRYNFNNK